MLSILLATHSRCTGNSAGTISKKKQNCCIKKRLQDGVRVHRKGVGIAKLDPDSSVFIHLGAEGFAISEYGFALDPAAGREPGPDAGLRGRRIFPINEQITLPRIFDGLETRPAAA